MINKKRVIKIKNIKILDKVRDYGYFGIIRIFLDILYTKIFFKKCRLIRRPIFIRGKKNIIFEENLTTGRFCRIEAFGNKIIIKIGKDCQINDNVHIAGVEKILIGKNVLIASKVFISDHNHGNYKGEEQSSPSEKPSQRILKSKGVIIEDNVWIGEFCSILPGVTIGKGSIIGSNSTVTESVPPFSIAVGNPAKIIKKFDFEKREWIRIG